MEENQVHPLVLQDPERYRESKNGAIIDNETRKFVAMQPAKNPANITKDNSLDYHAQRRKIALAASVAARRGIARASTSKTFTGAWADIHEGLATAALDKKQPLQARARTLETIARTANVLIDTRQAEDSVPGMRLELSPEVAERLISILMKDKEAV